MGNLLGAPVTEKETHAGESCDGLKWGVTSMQGWRIHMEDAHVAETQMYAAELVEGSEPSVADSGNGGAKVYNHINLHGHSIFAVFDGHGGTFAAQYAGRNLCRVLSRQPKFVQYAKFMQERAEKEKLLTKSRDRVQYITTGLEYIEGALRDAFVDLDMEIASALQGAKIAEADTPYHKPQPQNPGAGGQDGMDCSEGGQDSTSEADSTLQLLEKEGDSGTTACVVIVAPQWVVCANAGDSRSVFSKNGNKAVPLSYDHKPDDEEEERRIRAAGGYVAGGRVEGDLAVSRGLGDFRFKNMRTVLAGSKGSRKDGEKEPGTVDPDDQKVSSVPDVIIQNRSADKDEFIIVACDGIWDVRSNYECVQSVAEMFDEGESDLGLICEELCDACLVSGSKDNMTAIVVKFEGQKIGDGGGVTARRQKRGNSTGFPVDPADVPTH